MAKQRTLDVDELIGLTCSVEGCNHRAVQDCEMCGQGVCERHRKAAMGMDLCFSCHIGITEGLGMMKGGGW